jgi:enoyl-[acyl-carrier-protein] reductase (NADH)
VFSGNSKPHYAFFSLQIDAGIAANTVNGINIDVEDIASTVAFLASSAAKSVNGQEIIVDQGNDLTTLATCRGPFGGPKFAE